MERSAFFISIFLMVFVSPAGSGVYLVLCAQSLKLLCSETCRTACQDTEYSEVNSEYCAAETAGADDSSCEVIFGNVKIPEVLPLRLSGKEPEAVDECDKLERTLDKILCRNQLDSLENPRPTCSETPKDLEVEAALLSTEVMLEMEQYGELLTRDYNDVSNRSLLCEFSMSELEKNYKLASEDPESLRVTQSRTRRLQDCRKEWEKYYRNRSQVGDTSDVLTDQLVRDSQETMKPLTDRMKDLSRSISSLERAEATIENLILVHHDWCPSEGTGATD